MINKIKNVISNHKEETVAIGALLLSLLIVGTSCYKLGAASAWPPKNVHLETFERNGQLFLVLNGVVFHPKK